MFIDLVNFFVNLGENYGLLGVGIGMFLESLGVPFGGMAVALGSVPLVSQGRATYPTIILVATVGTTAGSIVSYYVGYFFGEVIRRFHHGHLINREDILKKFVDKYGEGAVFFAQLFGASRSFISLPAGVVRMKIKPFIIGTLAGSLLINTAMVVANIYLYDTWKDISNYFGVPMWMSMIVTFFFILSIGILYKMRARELTKKNGEDNEDRAVQKGEKKN